MSTKGKSEQVLVTPFAYLLEEASHRQSHTPPAGREQATAARAAAMRTWTMTACLTCTAPAVTMCWPAVLLDKKIKFARMANLWQDGKPLAVQQNRAPISASSTAPLDQ